MYLQIMACKESLLLMDIETSHVLKHILAVLMFRGALLGIDFKYESNKDYFNTLFRLFSNLRDYCYESKCSQYKMFPIARKIHLFLLHNSSFNKHNKHATNMIDFQLHNPQFTTLINNTSYYCILNLIVFMLFCLCQLNSSKFHDLYPLIPYLHPPYIVMTHVKYSLMRHVAFLIAAKK